MGWRGAGKELKGGKGISNERVGDAGTAAQVERRRGKGSEATVVMASSEE